MSKIRIFQLLLVFFIFVIMILITFVPNEKMGTVKIKCSSSIETKEVICYDFLGNRLTEDVVCIKLIRKGISSICINYSFENFKEEYNQDLNLKKEVKNEKVNRIRKW